MKKNKSSFNQLIYRNTWNSKSTLLKKQSTTNIKTTYIIHTPFPILIRQYPYTYWALSADYKRTLEFQNPVCLKKEEANHD